MSENYSVVNDRHTLPKGVLIGYPKPDKDIQVIVHLKSMIDKEKREELNDLLCIHPCDRSYLSIEDLETLRNKEDEIIEEVKCYFSEYNFTFDDSDPHSILLECDCTVEDFEKAFHTKVAVYETVNHHSYLAHSSPLCLPAHIATCIMYVSGLTIEEKFETRTPTLPQATHEEQTGWDYGFSLPALGAYYNFPTDVSGKGECIAIVELGGEFKTSDITKYFKAVNLPKPAIKVVGTPPKPKSIAANTEVTLDIQIASALAPNATIVVYYAKTILDALRLIINDKENRPSVVSISWAAEEGYYSESQLEEFDHVLYEAALLGITIIAASGDYGAFNRQQYLNVSMPSSHPYVLGCGGTMPWIEDDEIKKEVVWNESEGKSSSGGGFSDVYATPEYQTNAIGHCPERGVPDISAFSGSENGYQIIFNGKRMVIGGTSAATPLWAALVALMNEKLGYRLGFANELFYKLMGSEGFNQILYGNNQYYSAGPNWNPCTGLGSPNGNKLFELINQ